MSVRCRQIWTNTFGLRTLIAGNVPFIGSKHYVTARAPAP